MGMEVESTSPILLGFLQDHGFNPNSVEGEKGSFGSDGDRICAFFDQGAFVDAPRVEAKARPAFDDAVGVFGGFFARFFAFADDALHGLHGELDGHAVGLAQPYVFVGRGDDLPLDDSAGFQDDLVGQGPVVGGREQEGKPEEGGDG